MSFLTSNVTFTESEHTMITIAGEPGMGKTTLGAMCEAPLFIRAEQGTRGLSNKIARLPVIKNSKDLFVQLTAVLQESHEYKTLVFDSVTALDVIFAREIVSGDRNATTISDAKGGWGAGRAAVADLHHKVHRACRRILDERAMNILFLAHTEIKTINPPDSEPYMKYTLRMMEMSSDPYTSGVDAVGFIRQEVFYRKAKGARVGKVTSADKRVIIFDVDPALVSKNRFGITKPIPFRLDKNPLVGVIPGFDLSNKDSRAVEYTPEPEQEEELEVKGEAAEEADIFTEAAPEADQPASDIEREIAEEAGEVSTKKAEKSAADVRFDNAKTFKSGLLREGATELHVNAILGEIDEHEMNGGLSKSQANVLRAIANARNIILGAKTFETIEAARQAIKAVPENHRSDEKLAEFLKQKEAEISAAQPATVE